MLFGRYLPGLVFFLFLPALAATCAADDGPRKSSEVPPKLAAQAKKTFAQKLPYFIWTEKPASKAREVKPMAEKMLTLGRSGSLHARRQVSAFVTEPAVVRKVFGELAEKYRGKPGGYTRLVKLMPRKGDGAPMAQVELVL